jgi:hypothetical protein
VLLGLLRDIGVADGSFVAAWMAEQGQHFSLLLV